MNVAVLAPLAEGAKAASSAPPFPPTAAQPVVLLHGLARSAGSMQKMADQLRAAGYAVCNIDYPSRHYSVEDLAARFVRPAIERCFPAPHAPIHFVTHSMGGIVVRQLAATAALPAIGRVVMLSPPNHGSAVVDRLGDLAIFRWLNGPAGAQLGTSATSLPQRLGPARFVLGVITGTRSINPVLSTLLTGPNDGKVSVASAQLQGMAAFLTLPVSHPFIMRNDQAIAETLYFLKHGAFHSRADSPAAVTKPPSPRAD